MKMYLAVLLLGLSALAGGAAPRQSLHVGVFPQRMAERFTERQGLPPGRILRIECGEGVTAIGEKGAAAFRQGAWGPAALPGKPEPPAALRRRLPEGAVVLDDAVDLEGRRWVVTARGAFQLPKGGGRATPVRPPGRYLTGQQHVNTDLEISCVEVDGAGTVWWGTSVGIFATDGADWWNVIDRRNGLPYEEVTCLALSPAGEIWAGTTEGVCRQTTSGKWQYYWGPRWLPHNRVNDIALARDGSAWAATDGGVARLYDTPMTLERKAQHYQAITEQRHDRRGYVTGVRLKVPGKPEAGVVHHASDNDGLWTAAYVGAQTLRWAATRDPAAREAARRSMHAMLELVRLTGIPGFPARAVIRQGEEVDGYSPTETVRVEGETDRIWFASPVEEGVLCKGDTSSDELDGHYFAWALYHDLAADEAERRSVAAVVRAVTDNLLAHDYSLVGHTGRRTRWAVYGPRSLNDDALWWEERGLNALSILCYLRVAHHVTGDGKYEDHSRRLMREHHYLLNTVRQKVAVNWWSVNHSDDQMAFMLYYTLLRLEKSPEVRRILIQSLHRSWRIERPEASPFFNFVYASLTGEPCDAEAAAETLRDWPWELVEWQVRASHRHDVTVLRHTEEGRSFAQLTRVLPASERRLMRWNGNPYQADGGTPAGTEEDCGSAWLLGYWLGRYHGIIAVE